jgi:excisionase family DNA binding protein
MLTTAEVAHHFALTDATIRRKIRAGDLLATRDRRDYRVTWQSVWACEHGPIPKRNLCERYKEPLLSKKHLAGATGYDIRSVERWIEDGLPTRNVFGSVRVNPSDAKEWLKHARGFEIDVLERVEV